MSWRCVHHGPIGVALDANDNLFVGDAAGERVIEFHATPASPATNYTTIAPTGLPGGAMRSFTVNPATDEVWVLGDDGEGTHVKGFELDGTQFTEFGKTVFTAPFYNFFGTQKMAVNGKTGTVYVGDLIFTNAGEGAVGNPWKNCMRRLSDSVLRLRPRSRRIRQSSKRRDTRR